jgi:hypothetical protein
MFRKLFLLTVLAALMLSACNTKIHLPGAKKPGPDVTEPITVAAPQSGAATVELEFGAGELALASGGSDLVNGTATYNVSDLKPKIAISGDQITMSQGSLADGIPNWNDLKNEWDLKLGSAVIDLKISAGAYDGNFDFGGLSLKNLTISDGASDVDVDFSAPNKTQMNLFRYNTGASSVSLKHLGNANFSSMILECGAGNYTLDFSGGVLRDASVVIKTGVSNVIVTIPAGMAAQVTVRGGMSNVTFPSSWIKNGDTYTQKGSGAMLTIDIDSGAGNVQITD